MSVKILMKFNLKYLPVVDSDEYVETFTDAQINSDSPLVLILHTHTTEAYNDEGEYYESPLSEFARSHDENKNVIRIGQTIAKILNQNGIPTIHVKSYHDDISYNDAYANSERTIKSYLEKYPTIKYVFDIHRDALMLDDSILAHPLELNIRQRIERSIYLSLDMYGGIKEKYIQGNKVV